MTRIALDTNVLAYAAGVDRHPDDHGKIEKTITLLETLPQQAELIVPAQVLGELYTVLERAWRSRDEAKDAVLRFAEALTVVGVGPATMLGALDLAAAHRLQLWDAVILTAAGEAGATTLLSEDMHDGFTWRGVRVVNPFATQEEGRR